MDFNTNDHNQEDFNPSSVPEKQLPDDGSPLEWVRKGVFPEEWTLVPVAGKATYIPEWGSKKRSRIDAEALYQSDSRSSGFGVVTGELSGGLLAVDIDGPRADERFRKAVGDGYEPFGEETTMSWTSGKEGRRQILYRVPQYMVQEDRRYRKTNRGSDLPAELRRRQDRLERIRQARKEMEAGTAAAAARQRQDEADKARAEADAAKEADASSAEQAELNNRAKAAAAKAKDAREKAIEAATEAAMEPSDLEPLAA